MFSLTSLSDPEAKSSTNLFGSSQPSQSSSGPNLFSKPPPSFQPDPAASTNPLQGTGGTGGVFGMPPPSRPATEGAGLFGKPASAPAQAGSKLFGKNVSSSDTGSSG